LRCGPVNSLRDGPLARFSAQAAPLTVPDQPQAPQMVQEALAAGVIEQRGRADAALRLQDRAVEVVVPAERRLADVDRRQVGLPGAIGVDHRMSRRFPRRILVAPL
jgi:hypothetical protein